MMTKKPLEFYIAVDFFDDLINAPFYEKTFKNMMRQFKAWGVKRVYWIDEGAYNCGLWDWTPHYQVTKNAAITYQEAGEFKKAAVRYAHEEGLEIFIVIKPFDFGFKTMLAYGHPETARLSKGLRMVGGILPSGVKFVFDHPRYLMARNMQGLSEATTGRIRAIKLVKMDEQPTRLKKKNLSLWVSRDNYRYRKYQKPYNWEEKVENRPKAQYGVNFNRPGTGREKVRTITLGGLAIDEPYLALTTDFKDDDGDFRNHYYKLVELSSDEDKPVPFTYGTIALGESSWSPKQFQTGNFQTSGIHFDLTCNGTPSCNMPGYNLIETIGTLDNPKGFLGLARGKNPYLYGALCPAYPEVRKFWLEWVGDCLDAGADGVELRIVNHHDVWDWQAYGFNEPIVREYRKRYGLDIRKEEFDRGKWRKLRGEYYTRFVRDASRLVRARKKLFCVDVNNEQIMDETHSQMMEIFWEWRHWIKDGLVDLVTVKGPFPDSFEDREIRTWTRKYNIPTAVCLPNFWARWIGGNTRERIAEHLLDRIRQAGHNGWILYEASNVMKARKDGTFLVVMPEIEQILKPYFDNQPIPGNRKIG